MIGKEFVRRAPEPIGLASIRQYALALEDRNPLFVDAAYAGGTRHGGIVAPPTLMFDTFAIFDGVLDDDGHFTERWPFPTEAMLRAGNRYEWKRPARPDDVLTASCTLVGVDERDGRDGKLVFVNFEIRYSNQNGDELGTNYETLVWLPDRNSGATVPG